MSNTVVAVAVVLLLTSIVSVRVVNQHKRGVLVLLGRVTTLRGTDVALVETGREQGAFVDPTMRRRHTRGHMT